jgi:hypothetical protein
VTSCRYLDPTKDWFAYDRNVLDNLAKLEANRRY